MSPTSLPLQPEPAAPLPWWKHGWVWFLLAIPGTSILVGVLMLTLAINGPTGVVRDDYYKAGLAINEQLDGARRATALGVQAQLSQRHADEWWLEVSMTGTPGADTDLQALLQHPTLEQRDLDVALLQVGPGRWAASLPRLTGRRVLYVNDPAGQWQLRQELDFDAAARRGS